ATLQVKDELARVDGVGDVFMFGQQDYSMRLWVDPDMLSSRGLTAIDVVNALREQNIQVAAGQVGQPPSGDGQQFQWTINVLGRLSEPKQFADIVLKRTPDGGLVKVKDVGHVELGARSEDIIARLNGRSSVSVAIFQLPYANALDTADRVRE